MQPYDGIDELDAVTSAFRSEVLKVAEDLAGEQDSELSPSIVAMAVDVVLESKPTWYERAW